MMHCDDVTAETVGYRTPWATRCPFTAHSELADAWARGRLTRLAEHGQMLILGPRWGLMVVDGCLFPVCW